VLIPPWRTVIVLSPSWRMVIVLSPSWRMVIVLVIERLACLITLRYPVANVIRPAR